MGLSARDSPCCCAAWQSLNRQSLHGALRDIRIAIGEKMALGLGFFLAGNIIQTIVVPGKETLMVLGGIVVIHTVMAFFLAKEIEKSAATE